MVNADLTAAARMVQQPSLAHQISIFAFLSIIDLLFNAAAGAAAASTGVHVNSRSNSATAHNAYNLSRVLGLGALAGVMKSGILVFVKFTSFGKMNMGVWLILMLLFSDFGICVIVTSAVSSLSLGTIPGGLLIAAIVTAIPLSGELVGVQISPDSHSMGISLVGLDALAGYVFARMAHNEGYDICAYNAAATAGAVYGILTCLRAFVVFCIKGPNHEHMVQDSRNGTVVTTTNRFGTWVIHDPEARPSAFSSGFF